MLLSLRGLSSAGLAAVRALEADVLAADGGRLKLDWPTLRHRDGAHVDDLVWWLDGRPAGYLGLHTFGPAVELSGMVSPAARRQGVATRLLDAALALCVERGFTDVLLVVPRGSRAGAGLAGRYGGQLHHSEHALVLDAPPTATPAGPQVSLRPATPADEAALCALLEDGFGHPVGPLSAADLDRTVIIERDGSMVGSLRLEHEATTTSVYGFVVLPAWRGRGLGREALRRVCAEAFAGGGTRVALEVAVDNSHALHLYTSLGFGEAATEDYYALPLDRCSRFPTAK